LSYRAYVLLNPEKNSNASKWNLQRHDLGDIGMPEPFTSGANFETIIPTSKPPEVGYNNLFHHSKSFKVDVEKLFVA
jgi:hypothetical protein